MGDLSQNFSRAEFMCKCGCHAVKVDTRLVTALQQLRDALNKPITINSAYRCPRHNAAVGGVANSEHPQGEAADIKVVGMTVRQLYAAAEKIPAFMNGGIGVYPEGDFIHVDVRRGKARWGQLHGKYVSFADAWAHCK